MFYFNSFYFSLTMCQFTDNFVNTFCFIEDDFINLIHNLHPFLFTRRTEWF